MRTAADTQATKMMMQAVAAFRAKWDARKTQLWAMPRNALYNYAKEGGVPTDLRRPELIEAILRKEFPSR